MPSTVPARGPFPLRHSAAATLSLFVHAQHDAYISTRIAEQGLWEPYETELLARLLQPGSCFVDVGANIGYYSVIAAQCVGDAGRVYAFEPEADNFVLLQKNIAHNALGNVHAVHAALSDHSGSATLYLNEDNRGDHQVYAAGDARTAQAIALLAGAEYFDQREARIDVIKIDTQGAEAQVLRGLMPLLQQSLPALQMIIEVTPFSLRDAGDSGSVLLALIDALGLPCQLIDHIGHTLIPISTQQLADWIAQVDADPANEGFINLLVGNAV